VTSFFPDSFADAMAAAQRVGTTWAADGKRSVLEAGCAAGHILLHFRAQGWSVRGVDPWTAVTAIGRKYYRLPIDGGRMETADVRFEYATTSNLSFVHHQFRSGYWTRGEVISHFIGTEGQDYYARATDRLTPDLMLGLWLNRAVIGSTASGFSGPKERRLGGGIDLSYRFHEKFSLFSGYELMRVTNRNFRSGDDGYDHLFRVELTHSFR
jgi:hypothetical protein